MTYVADGGSQVLLIRVFVVQIISRLDSQSKFQMFTYFPAAMLGFHGGTPTWRHTGLCKFVQNILSDV